MNKKKKKIIVGLDIGTSKVTVVVAEIIEEKKLQIIGTGTSPSAGIKKGVIVNIESTVSSIQRALEEAELMADCKITDVWSGISGAHIKSINSNGSAAIQDNEVTQNDIDRVMETAKAIPVPTDHQIIHVLNQEFNIDDQGEIKEPLGMSGVRLEVKVHIVTGSNSVSQNILKCVRRCGLEVNGLMLKPLASSICVLSDDEKNLGVCMIDIGSGTTDLVVYKGGAIKHTAVVPIAGDHITNDIAKGLRTPIKEAEDIKRRYGSALKNLVSQEQMISVPAIGDGESKELSIQRLAEIIEPRVEELFDFVRNELKKTGFHEGVLASGLVITGGCSSLRGIVELAEEVLHLPVRKGIPYYKGPLADVVRNPRFSTVIGLIMDGFRKYKNRELEIKTKGGLKIFWEKLGKWFEANF